MPSAVLMSISCSGVNGWISLICHLHAEIIKCHSNEVNMRETDAGNQTQMLLERQENMFQKAQLAVGGFFLAAVSKCETIIMFTMQSCNILQLMLYKKDF